MQLKALLAQRVQCSVGGASAVDGQLSMEQLVGEHEALLSDAALQQLSDGELKVHADKGQLKFDEIKVYSISLDGRSQGTSVTIPLGGEYGHTSNVTVFYNDQGRLQGYSETQISKNELNNFQITSFNDGKLISSKDSGISYISNDELRGLPSGLSAPNMQFVQGIGSTVACLTAVLGVSGAVGYLIAGACAGSCAASATGVGAGVCIACIGAYATVGGASITAVASCFK